MDHWFDRLTRGLARETPSRRAVLRAALGASLGVAGGVVLRRFGGEARPVRAADDRPPVSACNICQEGQTLTFSFSSRTTFKGRELSFEQATSQLLPKGNPEITQTIKLDGDVLLRITGTKQADGIQMRADFGGAFKGTKRVVILVAGQKVSGVIGKRQLVPYDVGADPASIKFADGQPLPESKFPPDLPEGIKQLFEQAKRDSANCPRPPVQEGTQALRRERREEPQMRFVAASYADAPASPGEALRHLNVPHAFPDEPGHGSTPQISIKCGLCVGACLVGGVICDINAVSLALVCVVAYPACLALFLLGCAAAQVACMLGCSATGFVCCPVSCGEVACCDKGETCLDATKGVCCSVGFDPCGGKRCCAQGEFCIETTGTCCPQGRIECNGACCQPGQVCKDGVVCCAPTNLVCGGVCCGANDQCINNKCCPQHQSCGTVCCEGISTCADPAKSACCSNTQVICDGKCCAPGEVCVNGQCCAKPCGNICCAPDAVCCGGACCDSGETCLDAAKQMCSGCPQGLVGCLPEKSSLDTEPIPGICCPPGRQCCFSSGKATCCGPGESCCAGGGKGFGCHPLGGCIG